MKIIVSLIFLIFSVLPVSGTIKTDAQSEGLLGPVKDYKEGPCGSAGAVSEILYGNTYDLRGDLLTAFMGAENKVHTTFKSTYHLDGSRKKKVEFSIKYGFVTKETRYFLLKDGTSVAVLQRAKQLGGGKETTIFSKNGALLEKRLGGFSPDGQNKTARMILTVRYNFKGEIEEKLRYDEDNIVRQREVYRYTQTGTEKSEEVLYYHGDSNQVLKREKDTYDQYGSRTSGILYRSPTSDEYAFYTTYDYEYDAQGNWIKRVLIDRMLPKPLPRETCREITYYENPETEAPSAIKK